MSRPACLALATISLLVISNAAAHAQALAPSTLRLTGPEQETKTGAVQVITKEPAKAITKKPALVNAKEKGPEQKTKKETVQAITKKQERTHTAYHPVQLQDPRGQKGISVRHYALLSKADRLPVCQGRSAPRWQADASGDDRTGTRPCTF